MVRISARFLSRKLAIGLAACYNPAPTMHAFFSPNTVSLIQTFYDRGLAVDDIMERLDLHDDFRPEVQLVIDHWIMACDDTENPSEPGDLDYYPA